MELKLIIFLLIIIKFFQNGSCLGRRNCTGEDKIESLASTLSKLKFTFKRNPKMKFYLFTKKNVFYEQQIFTGNKKLLKNSNFNPRWPVRIIVHGWRNNLMSCVNGYIKDAYLKYSNFNVIVVDWGDWAQNLDYFKLVPYIFKVLGPLLANFIKFLHKDGGISFNNIYLIGHSLGAHLSGSAGLNIHPNKVNTIFGLDPAGPGFQGKSRNKRLDESHAKYVEQISTNMFKLGYYGRIGTAAFFPNYGILQPYCLLNDPINIGCSHSSAYWYLAESINTPVGFCSQSCSFTTIALGSGCPKLSCSKKILMGGEPTYRKYGTFLVNTNNKRNFANCNC